MDVTKLAGITGQPSNVHHVPYPHPEPEDVAPGVIPDVALYMGTPFSVISGLDRDAYIKRVNQCLAYIREQCLGCRLEYLVHPAETNEYTFLDLRGFQVIPRAKVDDTFFEKRRHELKYFFAAHSIAAMFAYSLGVNTYLFLDCFRGLYPESLFQWYRQVCFTEMPESFFIADLNKPLVENKKVPSDGHELREQLQRVLPVQDGTIWFIFQVTPLDAMLAVVAMVRQIFPGRRVGLILYRHHRWDVMDESSIRAAFDEVHVFRRTFYSLRPRRLLEAYRLTRAVRRFPIKSSDTIIGFAGHELLENCFISYHRKAKHISFWTFRSYLVHQNTATNPFFKNRKFHYTAASFVYNKILQPLLGLHRTVFVRPAGSEKTLYTVARYERPVNELYDEVFYLHA